MSVYPFCFEHDVCVVCQVKEEELMAAEELERHKMEARIRRRLRKISQVTDCMRDFSLGMHTS